MVYYKRLKSTSYYRNYHENDVSWFEVMKIIRETKNPKKKGNKFEIKTGRYYILYMMINKTAYVINAKRK